MAWPRPSRNVRLLLLSVLLGIVGALSAQVFLWMLQTAQRFLLGGIGHYTPPTVTSGLTPVPRLGAFAWRLPLALVTGGLVAGMLVYFFAPEAEGHGTDAVVRAYHREHGKIRARIPVIKSVASAITIGAGGSAGREGPTAQISAGIGAILGSLFKLSEADRRYLILIGMASGLSAIFKSPLGTAIFAVEILYGTLAFEETVLAFTIIGAAVSYGITGLFEGWEPLFHLPATLTFRHPVELLWYALLGVLAGGLAAVLPTVFYGTRDAFKKIPLPPHVKPAIGGLLLALLALVFPQVLGGGYGWMQLAIDGRLPVMLMFALALVKIPALSLTVGSGGSGGIFAPTLYVGAMLGSAVAKAVFPMFGMSVPSHAFAVVGMAAVFGAAARVPLATLVMVVEMTGGYQLIVPTMLSVVLAALLQQALTRRARYPSLYEAQVPTPADSPVHHEEYYRAALALLRRHQFHMADDMMMEEMANRLTAGQPVPLPGSTRALYSVRVDAGSEAAGTSIRALSLPDGAVIGSILRDRSLVAVHHDTVLEPGDRVIVTADVDIIDRVRASFGKTSGKRRAAK